MDVLAAGLALAHPEADKGWGIKVEPLHAAYHRQMQTPLLLMMGAVLFVLLIACVNVANLLLARATGRRREVAVRLAIGATRRRLIAQLLTESLLLASLGGALGLMLGYAGDRLLTLALDRFEFALPNARVITIDWRVVVFSLAITVATGLIFGLVPSLASTKTGLSASLKEGGASTTSEPGRRRLRNALVASEMALALILLTGAGLLVRTFLHLVDVDLGIDPKNVVTMNISLPHYKYSSAPQQALFFQALLQRLETMPGVKAAGVQGWADNVLFLPEGQPPAAPGQEPSAAYKIVSPDYFKTMGTPLEAGREFDARDVQGATPVAIVSETVARRYWPHSSPVGRHLNVLAQVYSGQSTGVSQALEIVGVMKDVRNYDLWRPEADIYVPFPQHPVPSAFLALRTSVPPLNVAPAVRGRRLRAQQDYRQRHPNHGKSS